MSGLVQAPTAVSSELSEPSESPTQITAASGNDMRYIGLTTRAIAFVVDAALICLVAFLVGEAAHLIAAGFHIPNNVRTILGVIGAGAFVLWAVFYHVSFWSATGQTPGDRVMHIRVVTVTLGLVKPSRGIVRCIGVVLAALPLFLGYAPVLFDSRRRSFADWLAGTVVIDAPGLSIAQSIAEKRRDAQREARNYRA
jgi:uncharacterized RDD family membrane protein YckC